MSLLLVALAFSSVSSLPCMSTVRVDIIELNHYEKHGKLKLNQVILWRWSPDYRRFDAHKWLPINEKLEINPIRKTVVVFGFDKVSVYKGKVFIETWTDHDPEQENNKLFPWDKRPRL